MEVLMRICAINSTTFKSITEEHRKPPIEQEEPVIHHNHKKFNPVLTTGWIGAGAIATSIFTGIKRAPLLHKTAAFIGAASIAAHIGLISAYHHKHHNIDKNV